MNKRRIIFVIACFAVMAVCISLGAYYRKEYISVCGVAFCCLGLTSIGVIQKIRALREIKDAIKEIARENKEKHEGRGCLLPKNVIALLVSFAVLLVIAFVGIVLANAGTLRDGTITGLAVIGFVLMGIGLGGFCLEILLLVIISKFKGR